MKYLTIIASIILFNTFAFTQRNGATLSSFIFSTSNESELVQESVEQAINGHLENALKVVDKLVEMKPDNSNYLYRKGYLLYNNGNNPKDVIAVLSKVKGKLSRNFDIYSTKNTASVDVYYFLAKAYHRTDEIDSAKHYYQLYLDNSAKNTVLYKDAELRLKQCDNAVKQLADYPNNPDSKNIKINNMGNKINSIYPDYSMAISPNGLDLFFTTKRPWGGDSSFYYVDPNTGRYTDDIYRSSYSFDDNNWSNASRLKLNTPKYNEGVTESNGKEELMYLYSDSIGKGDIMASHIDRNGNLGNWENLNIPNVNEKESWEPSIFITEDYKRIYFSSNRKGGFGGLDLYYSDKINDSTWSKPVNLGPEINTPYNEDAPAVSASGKYLFYASNNEKSMGGFDLFYAPIQADGKVGAGTPLNYPVNSTSDDIYYKSSKDGFKGFLTSDRIDSYGEKDLYEVENNYVGLEKLRFLVAALKTDNGEPLPETAQVRLTCTDCDIQTPMILKPKKRNGVVLKSLEPCHNYTIDYMLKDEVKKSESFKTDCDIATEHINRKYIYQLKPPVVKPIEREKTMFADFKKNFGYNENLIADANNQFEVMIDKAKDFLKNDSKATIYFEVSSSASHVPTKTFSDNNLLTQKRAENFKDLILKQFSKDQVKSGRVVVTIESAIVDGPEYRGDFEDLSKYVPFQFVAAKAFKK